MSNINNKEIKYTIGQVSKKFQIPITTIRFYEKKNLLVPEGTDENGNRLFSESNLNRVFAITKLRDANIGILEIQEYFDIVKNENISLEEKKNIVFDKRKDVEIKIENLKLISNYYEYKEWYYNKALEIGIKELEKNLKQLTPDEFKDVSEFTTNLNKEIWRWNRILCKTSAEVSKWEDKDWRPPPEKKYI